jgi:uroporphyrinogen decarboxylase
MKMLYEYQVKIYEVYFEKVGKYLDVVWTSDDYGAQEQLLISKDMWVEQVKPWAKKRAQFIKDRTDAKLFHHSCGSIHNIIPDMIEIGYDGLNPLQPFADKMEPERLKEDFGDELFFLGGLDHQFILTKEPEEVIEFTERLLKAYAPGGGYIFAPTHVTPDSANVDSFVEAYDFVSNTEYPMNL